MSFRQGARQFFERRGAPTPPLPYDAEVEYLESTGTQWIDTGISLDVYRNIGFKIKLNPLVSADIDPVVGSFCGYSNWGSRWFGVNYTSLSSRGIQIGLGDSGAYYSDDMSLRDYDIEVSSVRGVWIDGTQIEFSYGSDVSRIGTSFYLFAICARDGSGVNHISPRRCRIYNLIMYDGADVLEDLIPVRFTNELGQSEGAMYDRVSGALFRNAGTGAFTIGPDKTSWTNPYVTDGLVAMWDGEWNAGGGVHDANATVWTNLVTGVASANIGVRTWGDSWLETTGTLDLNLSDNEPNSRTMEVVFQTTSSDVQNVIMSMYTRRVIGTSGTSIGIGPYSAIPVDAVSGKEWSVSAVYPNEGNTPDAAYINGLANTDRTSGNFTNPVSRSIRIGGLYSKPFSGKVYSIRLYNRQLTSAEIAANYAIDKSRFNLP